MKDCIHKRFLVVLKDFFEIYLQSPFENINGNIAMNFDGRL